MPSGKRKISRRKKIKKLLRVLAAVLGIVLIAAVFYFAATMGPRSPDATPRATMAADSALADESRELLARFEATVGDRQPTDQELETLQRAIALQREFNSGGSVGLEHRRHLEEMESRLSSYLARGIAERSRAAEESADAHEADGRMDEALAAVTEAWELQREINSRHGRSPYRDASRETRLQQRKMTMETGPVYQRSEELEARGLAAAENRQWSEARRLLTEARNLQLEINELGRRNRFYDGSRMDRLSNAIAGLAVGEMATEVDQLVGQAADLEESGQFDRAAQLFERAMMLQNQINRDHPQSPFVSLERFAELDTSRQRALSGPRLREIESVLSSLRSALRSGNSEAVSRHLDDANQKVRQLSELFPRGTVLDFTVRLELDYLANVKNDLPSLRAALTENLNDLPGHGGWRMNRTEVSQRLYQRIMNANPSRNSGMDLPVDSVTYAQAMDFCRRAGWILGRPVVLPTRSQFEAAMGDWDAEGFGTRARGDASAAPSPVADGEANSHGFLFLVGNLGQWLADEPEEGRGLVAGGRFSGVVGPDDVFQVVNRNERSRAIGFRHMVGDW